MISDQIPEYGYETGCIVQEYLDNYEIWELWTDLSTLGIHGSLLEMPVLMSVLVKTMLNDRAVEIEAGREDG